MKRNREERALFAAFMLMAIVIVLGLFVSVEQCHALTTHFDEGEPPASVEGDDIVVETTVGHMRKALWYYDAYTALVIVANQLGDAYDVQVEAREAWKARAQDLTERYSQEVQSHERTKEVLGRTRTWAVATTATTVGTVAVLVLVILLGGK